MNPPPLDLPGLREVLGGLPAHKRRVVAFSGGPDSAALLHLLSRDGVEVRAVHVDHHLDEDSPLRARKAADMARSWGVAFSLHRLPAPDRESATPADSDGSEQALRIARYRILAGEMEAGDLLLTAHHADDQAETVLMRLFRGTGTKGLAGIPPVRTFGPGWLARPLLGWPRSAIEQYLQHEGIEPVLDPGNRDLSRDRNFVRHRLWPLLSQRWPAANRAISRAASHLREDHEIVEGLVACDLNALRHDGGLGIAGLLALPPARARRVIRHWLEHSGQPPPPEARLETFLAQLGRADPDRRPEMRLENVSIRAEQGLVRITQARAPARFRLAWTRGSTLELPGGRGRLEIHPASAAPGLFEAGQLEITSRSGGERIDLGGHGRRPLKKLFQEADVPPSERALYPLIWSQGELVAAGDRWQQPRFRQRLSALGAELVWIRAEAGTIDAVPKSDDPQS